MIQLKQIKLTPLRSSHVSIVMKCLKCVPILTLFGSILCFVKSSSTISRSKKIQLVRKVGL
jgi:hypothetical protein